MVMEVLTMSKWDQGDGLKIELIAVFRCLNARSLLGAREARKMGGEGILSDYLSNYNNYGS